MKAKNVDYTLKQRPVVVEADLPDGWEERFDTGTQRKFYIDHINKVSSGRGMGEPLFNLEPSDACSQYPGQLQAVTVKT